MIDPKLVRNYSSCLFENIKSDKNHQLVLMQISLLNEVILSSHLAEFAFYSPVISKFEKLKLIEQIAKKFKFEEIVTQFFCVIVKNARFKILPMIINEYNKLLASSRGIKSVIVESVTEPKENELRLIREFLEKNLKKIIEFEFCENKKLIGGVVLKHDSLLYDYSISGAIDRVEKIAKSASV